MPRHSRFSPKSFLYFFVVSVLVWTAAHTGLAGEPKIDFNRDIRPILSNNCFQCHGPDEDERKGGIEGLRLDTREGACEDLGGYAAITPGHPEQSEVLERVLSDDPDLHMPPRSSGKKITPAEIELLRQWIRQGAEYAPHWSYVQPTRPKLPAVKNSKWPRNPIDEFVLAKLEASGLQPSPEADRHALIRRLSLDLTGLPPTLAEIETFINDPAPDAYEQLVDRLLEKQSYGEHWARSWLDLARYADSAGYADDPLRTIWLYRDYVIKSLNENKPFDQFTIEQLAGDLLPDPTPEQLIATAFHRNTQTNSEGGTIDEEFRSVAIVDRVNTTFSVWMGTTMACAQCHTHKFDPITQAEYFRVFAILNNTADTDRKDEAPLYSYYTPTQQERRDELNGKLKALDKKLQTPTPELLAARDEWVRKFPKQLKWKPLTPQSVKTEYGTQVSIQENVVSVDAGADQDTYTLEIPLSAGTLSALQLEVLPDPSLPKNGPGYSNGNFVITHVSAELSQSKDHELQGRYVRVTLPGKEKYLSLAEVQVFQGEKNIAPSGAASQSSTDYFGSPELAIDGVTDGDYFKAKSTTHTTRSNNPWWELDLLSEQPLDRIVVWNRTDGNTSVRLSHFQVEVLNAEHQTIWKKTIDAAPRPRVGLSLDDATSVDFKTAVADFTQIGFDPADVLQTPAKKTKGWAVGGQTGQSHQLTLVPAASIPLSEGARLTFRIEQNFPTNFHTVGKFRMAVTDDRNAAIVGATPQPVLRALGVDPASRTPKQQKVIDDYFLRTTPLLAVQRKQRAGLQKQLASIKPVTVPICKELPPDQRRVTHIQIRGNYTSLGEKVEPGTPAAFPPIPDGFSANRLGLAQWLVDEKNPLTSRVIANRCWERIFGIGIVSTSGDFGAQGELPSHPQLLDWLACELVDSNWNIKAFLKLLVTSATYRQTSHVTPERFEADPDNRLLARGPRFRLPAETIRDQALSLAGLLSTKMYGPPVRPPQPSSGLKAAFGSRIDWKTSKGEDRYRRALYTLWRRSNPYPSLATFDAPNREVCTISRVGTNTPLQALVTLNDPAFIEAAQGLARRTVSSGGAAPEDRARYMLSLCLARPPEKSEVQRLVELHNETLDHFRKQPEQAAQMATDPLGPLPNGADTAELATWTVIGNVVLNLDELLMKR